ncbi:hypothetical protein [Pseudomonas sp. XK-1]|uniref:hypothetical protein n=1 Tax=Pseudomonas sp. XK-1 TaxID=3136019 RepID=UPI00311A46DA
MSKEKITEANKESLLVKAAHTSQVALVVLAIFGYFYTVVPVYQKERLAEEVAKSQATLESQKLDLESNTKKLLEIQEERKFLAESLERIRKDLARSEKERHEIKEATAFMTYEYYLPDGKPAKTSAEVQEAVFHNNIRGFISNLNLSCGIMNFHSSSKAFPEVREYQVGGLDESWPEYFPYTREEIEVWSKYGKQYPKKLAISCANDYAKVFLSDTRLSDYPLRTRLKASIDGVVSSLQEKSSSNWKDIDEPKNVITYCKGKREAIDAIYKKELKAVEDEYVDRESAWGEARREILRHNYRVSKINARNSSLSKLWEIEFECRSKAEALGSEITKKTREFFSKDIM